MLARLAHEQLVRHISLGPLRRTDAAALLEQLLAAGPAPPSGWRERVLEETGGLPYYLVSFVQELHAGQLWPVADALPWAIRQTVRYRIEAMPPLVRPLLETVAVAGGRSGYPLLLAITGRPEEQVYEALDAACREHLLEEEDQTYRFAYGVVRRAVESDLSHARRTRLSRRLKTVLDRVPTTGTMVDAQRTASEIDERAYHLAVLRRHERLTSAVRQRGSQR
jgi:hypothetical protein